MEKKDKFKNFIPKSKMYKAADNTCKTEFKKLFQNTEINEYLNKR
jgi:hypothetical protein